MRNDLLTSSPAPMSEAGSGVGDDGPIAILMRGVRVPLETMLRRLADELKSMPEEKLARLGKKLQVRFRTSFPDLKGVLGIGKPQGDLSPQQTMGLVLITAVSELLGSPKVIDVAAQPQMEALLRECLGGLDESARAALSAGAVTESTLDVDRLVKAARLVGYKLVPAQIEAAFAANPEPESVAQALAGDRIAPEGVQKLAGVIAACLVESQQPAIPASAPLRGSLLAEGQYDAHVKAIWDAISATEDDGSDVEDVINDTVIAYAEQNGLDADDLGDAVVAFGTAEGYIEAIEESAQPGLRAGLIGESGGGFPEEVEKMLRVLKSKGIKTSAKLDYGTDSKIKVFDVGGGYIQLAHTKSDNQWYDEGRKLTYDEARNLAIKSAKNGGAPLGEGGGEMRDWRVDYETDMGNGGYVIVQATTAREAVAKAKSPSGIIKGAGEKIRSAKASPA